MLLIKLENGVPTGDPIVEENFFMLFKGTSFTRPLQPESVEGLGYGLYAFSDAPTPDQYQKVIEVAPVKDNTGIWTQTWSLVSMSDAEKAEEDSKAASSVRGARNRKLTDSDWTQIADAPVDQAAWATYRQALRDVPSQEGFPYSVSWPTRPE